MNAQQHFKREQQRKQRLSALLRAARFAPQPKPVDHAGHRDAAVTLRGGA